MGKVDWQSFGQSIDVIDEWSVRIDCQSQHHFHVMTAAHVSTCLKYFGEESERFRFFFAQYIWVLISWRCVGNVINRL